MRVQKLLWPVIWLVSLAFGEMSSYLLSALSAHAGIEDLFHLDNEALWPALTLFQFHYIYIVYMKNK